MPVMNGLLASQEIKKLYDEQQYKTPFIVALTAHIDDTIIKSCETANIDVCASVPLDTDWLFDDVL